jgi:hypothetical protein
VDLTQYYEKLRQEALSKSHGSHGLGLTLLLRQGLTAWMRALSDIPNPQNSPLLINSGETIETTPLQAELINLLVAMVLGQKKES